LHSIFDEVLFGFTEKPLGLDSLPARPNYITRDNRDHRN